MSKCLNLGDRNISKMVSDFGEVTVSKLLDTYFPNTIPTYQDFISNKNIKQELGLIPISKVKSEIGRSMPKQINSNQLISLKATVSAINNRNFKNNVPTVYSLYNIEQVGQSDLNTWGLKKLKGTLDIEAKLERAKNRIVDPGQSNISVSDLEAMIDNDEYFDYEEELTPQEQFNTEEARQMQKDDAQRLGVAYDDSYLFQLTSDQGIKTAESVMKDVAVRLTERIGIPAKFINDVNQKFKGRLETNDNRKLAIINLAYATLDTPIHEIIGHPLMDTIQTYNNTLYNNLIKELNTGVGKEVYDRVERTYNFKEKEIGFSEGDILTQRQKNNNEILSKVQKYLTEQYKEYKGEFNEDIINLVANKKFSLPNDANQYMLKLKGDDVTVFQYEAESKESIEKEALVELLGLMAADKIDKKQNKNLVSLLKELLKRLNEVIRRLISSRNVDLQNLPENATLGDISDIIAYSNNKLILPGYKVKYTTPDNVQFPTYGEASQHISELANSVQDIDLSTFSLSDLNSKDFSKLLEENIKKTEERIKKQKETILLKDIKEFSTTDDTFTVDFELRDNQWYSRVLEYKGEKYEELRYDWRRVQDKFLNPAFEEYIRSTEFSKDSKERLNLEEQLRSQIHLRNFIEKNKQFEQSKEIIEEWKKVNNIKYNPEEVYSRGQGFYSAVGAYSDLDIDLLFQNLLDNIDVNEKVGGEFVISAFTKPVSIKLGHLEREAGVNFVIYPKSEDIKWASNMDVYSGSVWDAPGNFSRKKSELIGVSYTKAPQLNSVHLILPNLADTIDKLSHHHNELGIRLTKNNFRLEAGENTPVETKKLVNSINNILDQKYGKITKPNISEITNVPTTFQYWQQDMNEDGGLDRFKMEVYKKNDKWFEEFFDTYGQSESVREITYEEVETHFNEALISNSTLTRNKSIEPTITNENIKVPIEYVKADAFDLENKKEKLEKFKSWLELEKKNPMYTSGDTFNYTDEKTRVFVESLTELKKRIDLLEKEVKEKKEPKFDQQALINAKIAALKSAARIYPRILIRSEVVQDKSYTLKSEDLDDFDLPFQKIPLEVNPMITDEQLNQQFEEVRRLDELEVEEPEDSLEEPDTIKGKAIAIALAEKLQTAFGMEYEIITPEMAKLILERTPTPYGNQPAFFHANKIYIIEGNVTADNVLHEFAHPLIKGILKQNPELFKSLYSQLQSTIEGQEIIAAIKAEYPKLEEGTDRFMEEAMVTSIERMASQKANNQTAFGKFIEKLMFALKKVLRSLFTGKTATKVNLNKLSAKTTLGQLADMLANKEFVIEDLQIESSIMAEFRSNEIAERIAELKAIPVVELQQQIDKIYNDTIRQLDALKQAPFKVKEDLLKSKSTKILNYVKEELEKYQTINISAKDVDPDNIINAIADIEQETKLRSLALINSLNEIKVFTEGIDVILKEVKGSAKQTNENISKVVYYKGFLKTQEELISNLKTIPGLSKDSLFYKTLNSIGDSIITANSKIKEIEFNFISEFFNNETELMGDAVENNFRDRATLILKAEGVSEADIETFINKIINNPDGNTLKVKDLGLNIDNRRAKKIVNAAQEYYHKRLGRQQIQEYLRGERGDLGYFTNWITPYANMDDPIAGGFVKFIKTKMADALTASQNQADDITVKLLPLLNAVGYNPAKTTQLGDMLLFTDKIGYTTKGGVFEEKDVLTFLNKFKNYRADRARLQNNFDQAKATKDKIKMKEAYEAIQDFDEKYMHRKFKKEFYDIQKIWKTGAKVINPFTKEEITVGPKVAFDSFLERQQDLDKMNTLKNVHFLELEDMYELGDSEEQARLQYNRLFDTYGLDGKPKTGEELERVLLRQKHRELSRGMYDYSSDTDRIQKDLDNFSNQLLARGLDPEQQPADGDDKNLYQKEMDRFFKKNLKTAYTSEYYKSRQQIFEDIRKISEKAGIKSQVVMDLAELYKERYRLANSTADNNGQPNGVNFTPEQIDLLRNIEEKIVALEASFDKKSGLLKEELARLKGYIKKSSQNIALTAEEREDYAKLYSVKNEMALSPLEQQILRTKFSELSDISTKEATDYYVEAFNYAIKDLGLPEITIDNADSWINSTNLEQAMAASKDFTQWFTRNHYTKQRFDFASGENINTNLRLNVWTVTKPSYESAYQKTTLIDPYTKEEIIKEGVPAGKYTKSVLKNSLLTIPRGESWDDYVGTIIDNRGNFLPRAYTPGDLNSAFNHKYMNEKYEALEKENSAEFKLLKAVTESMLKIQENKATNSRLYLDMPRFRRRSNLEYLESGQVKDGVSKKVNSFKDIWATMFGKSADDVEYGYNFEQEDILVSTDLEGNAKTKIPVRGTYNLDSDLVSKDVMRGMYEYLLSLNEQEILRENEPIAQALSSVLGENAIKELDKIDYDKFKLTGKKEYIKDKHNNRKDAINYLIDKTFYGKPNSDFEKKNPGITKVFQGLFRRSSRAFIAFDPQSAIKNRWGMLYQNMILASGGKHLTLTSLAKGKLKAKESAAYWIFKDVYAKGMKTQDIQLIERFDPALRARSEFGKSSSRSIAKDLSDMTYAFDFRRTMEYEASMELFWGVMYNKYVDQNGVSIPYAEAWTTDAQGILQLKEGIDPNFGFREINHVFMGGETLESIAKKYNISVEELKKRADINSISDLQIGQEIEVGNAKEFNRMKLLVQGVNKKATGSMDKFDTPHAEKYLIYRAFTFYKRFATGMFMDKYQFDTTKGNFGGHVYNWDTMTLERGYNPTAIINIKNLIVSIGKDWPLLTKEEKAAMRKVMMEGLLLFLLAMVIGSWVFGYDPEDEERWAKIEARGVTNIGHYQNHLLYLLIMTKVENEAFVPGFGTKALINYFGSTTIATTNTIEIYAKIMQNLWDMSFSNPDAAYQQDVGPYSWQKKGKYKIWNNIGVMYGLKGKNKDAYWAIKKYETFENLD